MTDLGSREAGVSGREIKKWGDEAMFVAEPTMSRLPEVILFSAPPDPLGQLAFFAKAYQGRFPESLEAISDADRRYYIQDMEKNILGMPSEAVMFNFSIRNVTRSFTHQLVRTRHASYSQESLRFAVKADFPVGFPPWLAGVKDSGMRAVDHCHAMGWKDNVGMIPMEKFYDALEFVKTNRTDKEQILDEYIEHNEHTQDLYIKWIEMGMPAEDARYITPHGILTRINMAIDLRSLMAMSGQRLCTQAQFEHRLVWDGILRALRDWGETVFYRTWDPDRGGSERGSGAGGSGVEIGDVDGNLAYERSSMWQYALLADRFKPICYQTGRCQFRSDFDRYCNIRDRVEANHAIGRPSSEWGKAKEPIINADWDKVTPYTADLGIPAIGSHEWLSPMAAIRPTGEWRSEEAQDNIKGRR